MGSAVERFEALMGSLDAPDHRLVVVNRTEVDPIQRLLERAFERQSVAVEEAEVPAAASDVVLLLRDDEVLASSPLQAVIDACLMINSDLYRSGPGGIGTAQAPEVITALEETVFDLRGYPASNKEKLLLILVSRYIEATALAEGSGTLRATFQRISRISTELGTRDVYRLLARSGVETHVYGQPDGRPPDDWDLTVHTGDDRGYRETWCVVYLPPETERHAVLVALETDDNEWRGFWSFDPAMARRAAEIIVEEF